MTNFTVTISRGFGSGGRTIGKMLAERLGIHFYDREIMELASEKSGISLDLFDKADEAGKVAFFKRYDRSYGKQIIPPDRGEFTSDDNLFNFQAKVIKEVADREDCVIVGRCADHVLADKKNVLRIFIYSSMDFCIDKVVELYGLSRKEAERKIEKIDRARSTYYRYYTGSDWDNARNYDLCLNTEELGFERCVDIIEYYVNLLYRNK
ncbi:MAG: cytidylate kinase-like family protein [Ruminococcaceae bacterium]|nr:cytidylate kinase-like family protein [Oscillospiraceae bacterium]MBQ2757393.1 cytidylate kinase-like family protein [Clostridia bacterium]